MTRASDTWESVALSDMRFRRDALLGIRALAHLADHGCRVKITKRSFADALLGTRPYPRIAARDPATRERRTEKGWEMAAGRALKALSETGYLVRLNADAPRKEPGEYLLTVPATRLGGA